MHTVTVDELSYRLKRVAKKLHEDRESRKESRPMPGNLPRRNDVASALEYVNKRFCIGISWLGDGHLREDARSCILHDLANLPLEMVIGRLQTEGAVIQ